MKQARLSVVLMLSLLLMLFSKVAIGQEDFTVQLSVELERTINHKYNQITYVTTYEDAVWVYGAVRAQDSADVPPISYGFLIKKSDDGSIDIAYQYTPKFDEWLKNLPSNIISEEAKKYMYSQSFRDEVNGASSQIIGPVLPDLSFPWGVGKIWRINQGPHLANPKNLTGIMSGLDFGVQMSSDNITILDAKVYAAQDGVVTDVDSNCFVWVSITGGWQVRYLHLKNVPPEVATTNIVHRGQYLGEIPPANPCYMSTGPHLHFDIANGLNKFVDFRGFYIGGWYVKDTNTLTQGFLSIGSSSKIQNREFHGSTFIYGPLYPGIPQNQQGSAAVCDSTTCNYANDGTSINPDKQGQIKRVYLSMSGLVMRFKAPLQQVSASSTNISSACLNFDVDHLDAYRFPGTNLSLLQNATEITIESGTCGQSEYPTTENGTITVPNPGSGGTQPTNYGCSNQITGIKFTDGKGNCFYMSGSGNASLPFSPTSIQVLDAKYDMHLCNRADTCDEFNKSGSIDYSSVSRPFVRAEVSVQGLVSDSTVASCQTRTGRKVEFGSLTVGAKYYTDRSYTIKNITKNELVGMRFLRTPNDDKSNGDPEYITCNIKKDVQVILGIDGRATKLPSWIKDNYVRQYEEVGVTDNDMQHFDLYKCMQKGGFQLRLGGPNAQSASGIKSNYIVIFREVSGDAGQCSAKFNVAPDVPVLNQLEATNLQSAPLLSWSMSDRNIHDDYLQAMVRVWKNGQLLGQDLNLWLPIGVTQWVPIWNEAGDYTTQVVVRDSKGLEGLSNQVAFTIHELTTTVVSPVVGNLTIKPSTLPTEQNQTILALVQNVGGSGQVTTTVHFYEKPGLFNWFSEMEVPLNGSDPTTITLQLKHFYDDYELVVDSPNKFVETNEGDNSIYVASKFSKTPFESGIYSGDIIGIAQNGKVMFEPSGISDQGMLTYVSNTYLQKCIQDQELAIVLQNADPNVAFSQYFTDKGNAFGGAVQSGDVITPSGFYLGNIDQSQLVDGVNNLGGNLWKIPRHATLIANSQGTWIRSCTLSSLDFRQPWGSYHQVGTDYQSVVNQMFVSGCVTGCKAVTINKIDQNGLVTTDVITSTFANMQTMVYQGSNSECENPAEYTGVDNPDNWIKQDIGCGWARNSQKQIAIDVSSGHKLDSPQGSFCSGQHVVTAATLWNESSCDSVNINQVFLPLIQR